MQPSWSRHKQFGEIYETIALIPGLPNDIASLVLSCVPYSHQSRLKQTCKSWCLFFSSKKLLFDRSKFSSLSQLLCIFPQDPFISSPLLFDAANRAWRQLPPLPCNPSTYSLCNFASVSLGPHIYLLGGSNFDARSFPLDRPLPSDSAFRFNFITFSWERITSMISPRGSFAYAAVQSLNQIIVAGGGSRHSLFAAAGSRISSVERYDVEKNEWVPMNGLPRFRAGCVGFLAEDSGEFWVMGGYGESRTVSGVLPVDEYYRDAVVMELKKNGHSGGGSWGTWREVGDMWGEGQARFGKIVVMEDENRGMPEVFMLDKFDILSYDMASNRWQMVTTIPRKLPCKKSLGFIVLDRELHVMTLLKSSDLTETGQSQHHKRSGSLFIQIYNPRKKTWRYLFTKPPFPQPLDFETAVMCTVQL